MEEMTAKEYFRAKVRLVGTNDDGTCSIRCEDCPLSAKNNSTKDICGWLEVLHPEEAIAIVQKWAEEHPVKTMLTDLLEKYPSTPLNDAGFPSFCPHELGYEEEWNCVGVKCRDCWGRSVEATVRS